ncbi:MAG: MBL fold metallo-hydrolase, partial [Phototrophicales bacterium]
MQVKFWGTRGLVSAPRLSHKQYGGNTCCIEIKHNQQSIIIDAGFGISLLGDLFPLDEEHEFHILFTHFHWDHIQG